MDSVPHTRSGAHGKGLGRAGAVLLLALTALLGLQGVFSFSPVSGILDDRPPLTNDFSLLTYQCETARRFFAKDRALWGYDPYFMAGYPLDFVWNSNVLLQLLSVLPLSRSGGSGPVLKALVLVCFLSVPSLFYATCRNFSLSPRAALFGALLGVTFFRAGLPVMFLAVGMVTACMVTLLSPYLLSLFYKAFTRGDQRSWLLLFFWAPAVFLVHKTALLTVAVPVGLCAAVSARSMTARKGALLLALAAGVCAANSFWLLPFLRLVHYKTFLEGALFWQNHDPLRPLWDLVSVHQHIGQGVSRYKIGLMLTRDVLLGAGIVGLFGWGRQRDRGLLRVFVPVVAYFFLLGYYGSFIAPLRPLDPARYIPLFYLCLVPPAAALLASIWDKATKGKPPDTVAAAAWWAAAAFLLLNLLPNLSWSVLGKGRVRTHFNPVEQGLLAWIEETTDTQGRILVEDSGYFDRQSRGLVYFSSYLPSLVPILTGRALIGGPYPYAFIQHHHASFQDAVFLGRPIESYRLEDLQGAFDLYNIRWVICWSGAAKSAFDRYPDFLVPKAQIGRFKTYEARRSPTYFLSGSGRLSFDYNTITLEEVHAQGEGVVISFHWMETLQAEPAARIEPVLLGADPVPFIQILDPPPRLTIRATYLFDRAR
jgi:hypothetical protein